MGSPSSLDSLRKIERAEQRLWLLALVLFLLLAVSVLALDTTAATVERAIVGMTDTVKHVLANYATSAALLCVVLLACAYFYESLVILRRRNRELVRALDSSARSLALRNQQLESWNQVSHRLITNFNLPRLLELIVRTAAEVTESDCALVMLAEGGKGHLRLAAIHRRGLQTELARRVAAIVIETGEQVHLQPESLPEELDRPDLAWEDLVSLAAAPLVAANAIRGALLVGRVHPQEPFPDRIVDSLASFASQASIALEKAHLYAQSQRQLDRLGKLLDDLRSAEAQLHQYDQFAGLGALEKGVAHVVDNSLPAIVSRAQRLLERRTSDNAEEREDMAALHEQTTRVADTLRNLLDLCRRSDRGAWQTVDVNRVVQKALDLMGHELQVSHIEVLPTYGDVPVISGSALQLEQAFVNIVLGATQRVTDGGRLAVETRPEDTEWVMLTVETAPPEDSPAVQEEDEPSAGPVRSAAAGETELAAVERIVRTHGGEIVVTGGSDRWVRFVVRLPAAASQARDEQLSGEADEEKLGDQRVGLALEA